MANLQRILGQRIEDLIDPFRPVTRDEVEGIPAFLLQNAGREDLVPEFVDSAELHLASLRPGPGQPIAEDAEFLRDEGVIGPEDVELFSYAETAQDVLDRIINWYTERGIDPRDRPRPYRS